MKMVNQPSLWPTNKLLAQSVVTLIAFLLLQFTGIDLTAEIELAGSVVVGFGISYLFIRDRDNTPPSSEITDDA